MPRINIFQEEIKNSLAGNHYDDTDAMITVNIYDIVALICAVYFCS